MDSERHVRDHADAYSYAHTYTYAYANSDADADAYPNTDAYPNAHTNHVRGMGRRQDLQRW